MILNRKNKLNAKIIVSIVSNDFDHKLNYWKTEII